MMFATWIIEALLLSGFVGALPQNADTLSASSMSSIESATGPITTGRPAAPISPSSLESSPSMTTSLRVSTISAPGAPLPTSGVSARFIGWSSSSRRSGTTRYTSLTCSRSSIYITSTFSGTTYAGCCDTRLGNNCALEELALFCVNNVLMAGNKTLSDCGSVSTCMHATIFRNVEDEEAGLQPTRFHACAYYAYAMGETVYRTLPSTNATTGFLSATSTSTSSSGSNSGVGRTNVGAAVGGTLVGFLVFFVIIPLCLVNSAKKKRQARMGGAGRGAGVSQARPPVITAPPAYVRDGDEEEARRKPETAHVAPPPRYEDVSGDRIIR